MVDEFLTDDEQAEALKTWWRENWAWVMSGIVVGLGLLVGWQYYQRNTVQRAEAASLALDEFAKAQEADKAKADTLFKELTDKYAATPYAMQAQLLAAQHAVETGDLSTAEAALRVVMEQSKDKQLAEVAKLRLARVLIEQDKADAALTLLDPAKAGAFGALTHETRGDALLAKQDTAAARSEYETALAAFRATTSGDTNVDTSLLELKIQDLGKPTVPATATASAP